MTSSVPLTPDVEGGRGTTSQGAGGLIDRHRRAILAGIVVLGMALRTRGFSSGTLFRDDSWVALSARMSARSAWSLVTAAPGDLYFFRTWVSINPSTLWWAQIPSFLAGTAGILAIYLLVRRFGFASWVALFAALVLATAVMPAVFSTHLKPYVFDLLWTCLLIALEETARHTSRARPTITFALVAIVATWWSLSIAPVVIACSVMVVMSLGAATARRRLVVLGSLGVVAGSMALERMLLSRGLPKILFDWFSSYYLSLWPPSALWHTWTTTGGRIVSALTIGRGGQPPWAVGLGGVVLLVILSVAAWRRARIAVVALGILVLSNLAHVSPIGAQRSDISFIPVYLLLGASGLDALADRLADRPRARRLGVVALGMVSVVLVAASVVSIGPRVHEWSDGDFRRAAVLVHHLSGPGTLVVTTAFVGDEWAYYEFSPPVAIEDTQEIATGYVPVGRPGVFFDSRAARISQRDLPMSVHRVLNVQFANEAERAATAAVLRHAGFVRTGQHEAGRYAIYVWDRR